MSQNSNRVNDMLHETCLEFIDENEEIDPEEIVQEIESKGHVNSEYIEEVRERLEYYELEYEFEEKRLVESIKTAALDRMRHS